MPPGKSGSRERAETKAAKESERADMAEKVWSEVKVQKAITDEKTARLKAQRLARDAEKAAAAKSSKPAAR